ncbi:MAG TPA: hypothetical protein VHX20_15070 [Terracidiphilus sp.]|jgi:hypothetical protein|nr:hypothetical protein [Terracidiphilus sp.]
MNPISNIWNHPKTSAAGVLIAVITVAGVLSQQGVTLGQAGAGTIISLVSAVATALLGLLARDPEPPQTKLVGSSASDRLGAWMLIVLLLPLPWLAGCSGTTVAQDIVNWTPALQSAVTTVDSTAALLAPADAPIFSAATIGFNAASTLLANQARAYLANPSAGTLAQLQTQVTTFAQQVNAALLTAAKIVNPASQQHALAAVQAVATIVSAILALVQSISSKAAVARMAAASVIKLAVVAPYLNNLRAAQMVAAHYREPIIQAEVQVAFAEQSESAAGF